VLGLASVREKIADGMAEVAIGYPDSPLSGPALRGANGPKPGERVVPVAGPSPVGAGDTPRFALFAERSPSVADLFERFDALLDPDVRPAFAAGAMTLVRPYGYVACTAKNASEVADYLNNLR
jgi:hypothetical protein